MVESQASVPISRASTPTQRIVNERASSLSNPPVDDIDSPRTSSDFYDPSEIASLTISEPFHIARSDSDNRQSMQSDAKQNLSDTSMPDRAKTGNNRRRSRSQLPGNAPRTSGHPQNIPTHTYTASSSSQSDALQNHPPTGFQGPYSPPAMSYAQPLGYGHYTMSGQPSQMAMASSPSPFPYAHAGYHSAVPDNSMIPQNTHAGFQHMLQPPGPVYSYQQPSPDGTAHPSYSTTHNPPMYPPHQANASPSPSSTHGPQTSAQGSGLSPSYVGPSQYQSMRYASPLQATYGYRPQPYQTSPLYPSQFPPASFSQHFASTPEAEPQGTWFYLPHGPPVPSPQQYEGGSIYQNHYGVPFSHLGHPEADGSYRGAPVSSGSFPSSPSRHGTQSSERPTPDPPPPSSAPHSSAPHSSASLPHQPPSDPAPSGAATPNSDSKVVRQPYHPNPPASRSEWVMWTGNVPSDATHDELWRFFTNGGSEGSSGVVSIFLISRSSCAFINYQTEAELHAAIARCNGVSLRPNDPRCPRLVCRVRRMDDDIKSGVGAQRRTGMHLRWVEEQKAQARKSGQPDEQGPGDPSLSPSSISDRLAQGLSSISVSSDEDSKKTSHAKGSNSTTSHASTTSSFLATHFPKRYFILKSLTQHDLDLSVERGLWATQKHNEEILDQAYRTSTDVYLIFSVNQSGEFYGYARMAGPIRQSEHRVSWASRGSSRSSRSSGSKQSSTGLGTGPVYFSPAEGHFVDSSPMLISSRAAENTPPRPQYQSAPAMLGEGYRLPTLPTPAVKLSLDHLVRANVDQRHPSQGDFQLDPEAPIKAMRSNQPDHAEGSADGDENAAGPVQTLAPVEEEDEHPGSRPDSTKVLGTQSWGDAFAVEWISTERLPFHRTRHIRNPWNHDREVKVSRDGTELEPTVGQLLLDEWSRLGEAQPAPVAPAKPTPSKRGTGSRGAPRRGDGRKDNTSRTTSPP